MAFGEALRNAIDIDSDRFDRVQILADTMLPIQLLAQKILRSLGAPPQT